MLSLEGHRNPARALERIAILCTDSGGVRRATVAGVLLCCRSPHDWLCNANLSVAHYRATGQVDAAEITGPLGSQVAHAMNFVDRNMRVAAHKMLGRVDLPRYSLRAVFEGVVNAVTHRDYSMSGSRVRLAMFSDRLEIQSPGPLMQGLTVGNMAERQQHRDPVLASVLGRTPVGGIPGSERREFFAERRSDGVPIILRETLATSGKPAVFRVIGNADLLLVMPSAAVDPSPAHVVVLVCSDGRAVAGAEILVLYPKRTWVVAATDESGRAMLHLHLTHLPPTVLVAAHGFAGSVEPEWVPAERALAINLLPLPKGGSAIFPEGSGDIPIVSASLTALFDRFDRPRLFASGAIINGGLKQPVPCAPGEDFGLADSRGCRAVARILYLEGRTALVEYRSE